MNKEYYVFVEGKKVIVTEEVYRAYYQPVWREERDIRRKWKCRDAHGVRCKRECSECQIGRLGYGATGNDLSIERMIEDEDPEFATVPDVADIMIIKDELSGVCKEIEKMSETCQELIKLITEGYSQRECAEILGVEEYYVSRLLKRIRKNLKKFLF